MHKGFNILRVYIFQHKVVFFYLSLPNEHSPSEMHVHMNYENKIPVEGYRSMPRAFILNG